MCTRRLNVHLLTIFFISFKIFHCLQNGNIMLKFLMLLVLPDLDFLFHMFFLARYCKLLEENSFRGRTADFFYMLLFGATVLTGVVLVGGMIPYVSESFAKIFFLSNSLTFMMVCCCNFSVHSPPRIFFVFNAFNIYKKSNCATFLLYRFMYGASRIPLFTWVSWACSHLQQLIFHGWASLIKFTWMFSVSGFLKLAFAKLEVQMFWTQKRYTGVICRKIKNTAFLRWHL